MRTRIDPRVDGVDARKDDAGCTHPPQEGMRMNVRRFTVLFGAVMVLAGCGAASPLTPEQAPSRVTIQSNEQPTELLVRFKPEAGPQEIALVGSAYGLRPKHLIAELQVYEMSLPSGTDVEALAKRVKGSPFVEYAEPNYPIHADTMR